MTISKKILGVTLATSVALSFAISSMNTASAQSNEVKCYGVNSCKGKSACQTSTNACKGQNSCKGKGYILTNLKKCKELGGSTEEPSRTAN
jgi:uncharacterized membrane protein